MKPTIGFLRPRFGFVLQELGGIFFRRAADLADHDDRLRLVVGQEHLEHVDELGALDRVAADADGRRLAETFVGGLEDRLIGQCAGARQDADGALLEDVARMMPILHSFGVRTPGQFGPISRDLEASSRALTLTMSATGMPSVMQTIRPISASTPR